MLRSLVFLVIASLEVACAKDPPRTITLYESFPYKKLQSSPYEISTWPNLRGISRENVRQIEALVAGHPEIRRPILRTFARRNDCVQVVTGHDAHRGDIYNCFDVVKRDGKWVLASPIVDSRTLDDRSEVLRRVPPNT